MYTLTHNDIQLETTPDPTLKDFFKKKDRFADLINCLLFHGQPILHDKILIPYDSNSSTVFNHKTIVTSINKNRDIMMKANHDNTAILIGLENQQTIDYTMPFRILVYDTITYHQQFHMVNKVSRQSFCPIPVMTCVLYYGDKKWRQPYFLTDRMTIPHIYKEIVNDWNGHIYDIKDIDISKLTHPDNVMMIEAVQRFYKWDKNLESLRDMILTKEVAIVVATIIGNKKFSIKVQKEESEEINMCTLFDEYVQERERNSERRGEIRGERRGEIKGKVSLLLTQLNSKFGVVSDELIMKIKNSTSDELEQVTLIILNAKSEEDIQKIWS